MKVRGTMEVRIVPAFVLASLGVFAVATTFRALGRAEVGGNSVHADSSRWLAESSSSQEPPSGGGPEKSIAQFLKEKVRSGLSPDEETEEFRGLDLSTRALLAEVLQVMTEGEEDTAADQDLDVLKFSAYGVARVVRRLVVCSAYRTSVRDFTVVALSPEFTMPTSNPDFRNVPPKEPAVGRVCRWLGDGSAEAPRFQTAGEMAETGRMSAGKGAAEFTWIGETHGKSYDVLLINCSFPEAVGTDLGGGFLYLNVTHGSSGGSAASELVSVLHEPPQTFNESFGELALRYDEAEDRSFRFEYAYCSGPVFTDLTPDHVRQFLMYHYALLGGSVHFFIYDSRGLDDGTMAVIRPLIVAGVLTVVNLRREKDYDIWYHGQVLAINDCLYRTRNIAKWTLFWDLDEYLHVRPPLNLRALLQELNDPPWVTFGKMEYDISRCAPKSDSDEDWAVERMRFRNKYPICGNACPGPKGARKWMANPRKVKAGAIHEVADFLDKRGVVLSAKTAVMNHYRGLAVLRGRNKCRLTLDSNESSFSVGRHPMERDSELASVVSSSLKNSVGLLEMFGGGTGR